MLNGSQVFVDIDTQRDFLEPSGALYVPGAREIAANLGRLTEFARVHGIPVLATSCAHTADDPEFRVFPPHCVIGTPGQSRIGETHRPGGTVLHPDDRLEGDPPAHLTVEKREYDLFSHPEADRLVSLYRRDDPTFVVYGVAADFCVKAAVSGLLDRGCRVAIVVDALRAIDQAEEAGLLTDFAHRGVLLAMTEVVCEG